MDEASGQHFGEDRRFEKRLLNDEVEDVNVIEELDDQIGVIDDNLKRLDAGAWQKAG